MTVSAEGLKILSFYPDARKLRRGEMIVPRFVSLWLTTGCDLACVYCYCRERNQQLKLADTESVRNLIKELSILGVEGLEFSGGGEPTLHPDCFSLAAYAKEQGLKVGLLTNGFRFTLDRLSVFHYVRVTLDAPTAEMYQRVKRGSPGRFEDTKALIHAVVRERGAGIRPRLGIKYMLCRENYNTTMEMTNLALKLGVDYCQFKPVHSCDVALSAENTVNAAAWIQAEKDAYSGFVYGRAEPFTRSVPCFLSPIHTVVTPTGDVLVCCYFNRPEQAIGNAFAESFARVWYSQRHWEAMARIPAEECGKIDCRWHYYNAEMLEILDNGKYDLAFI